MITLEDIPYSMKLLSVITIINGKRVKNRMPEMVVPDDAKIGDLVENLVCIAKGDNYAMFMPVTAKAALSRSLNKLLEIKEYLNPIKTEYIKSVLATLDGVRY